MPPSRLVAGLFTYSPASGKILNAGSNTLNVTFKATSTNYTTATASVTSPGVAGGHHHNGYLERPDRKREQEWRRHRNGRFRCDLL
jgi:hypothetical protein